MSEPTCDCPMDATGTRWHPADCPTVAFIKDVQRELLPSLIEMDKVRRRGAALARNAVIG
jgi:hypothetical protein